MKRFLPTLSLLFYSFLFITPRVFAQGTPQSSCKNTERLTDFGCIPTDPIGFVQKFYGIGLGFIGFVGVIFFLIGAYHVLTSQGDPEKLRNGKSYIFYSLAGILLAVFGFVFFEIIVGALKVPGFS